MHPHRHAFTSPGNQRQLRDPPPEDTQMSSKPASRTRLPRRNRIEPHENDVLLGRGGKNNRHAGNEKLRIIARVQCEEYRISSKKGKSEISRDLVRQMREMTPPGRFLRRSQDTGDWEDVGDEVAREKAGQVLRDAVSIQVGPVAVAAAATKVTPQEDKIPKGTVSSPERFHSEVTPPPAQSPQRYSYYSDPSWPSAPGYNYPTPHQQEYARYHAPYVSRTPYQYTPPHVYQPRMTSAEEESRKRQRLHEPPQRPRYSTLPRQEPPETTPPRPVHGSTMYDSSNWVPYADFSPVPIAETRRQSYQAFHPRSYHPTSHGVRDSFPDPAPAPSASFPGGGPNEHELLREELLSDHSDHEGPSSPLPRGRHNAF